MKTILVDAVDAFVVEDQGVYQPMFELLEQFPNRKIVLTNADDNQMVEFGLVNLPYELYSLKHNPDKTDSKYFEKMLANYGLRSDEVIYFEHNQEAVKSAQSLGITSYYYDPEKRDLKALEEFLLEASK